jgi:hypothetical protein
MDGLQGVKTEEQANLMRCVNQNLDEKKRNVPVIVIGNSKVDDPEEEKRWLSSQMKETEEKLLSIFVDESQQAKKNRNWRNELQFRRGRGRPPRKEKGEG